MVPEKIEKKRRFFITEFTILIVIVVIMAILVIGNTIAAYVSFDLSGVNPTFCAISLFLIVLIIVYIVFRYNKINKELKKLVMRETINRSIDLAIYEPTGGIPMGMFKDSNFIKDFNIYKTSDYMAGKLENEAFFSMCNLYIAKQTTYLDSDGKPNTTVESLFSGIFGAVDSKHEYLFDINIFPDVKNKYINQIVGNMKKMLGVKNIVRLENTEFERYFEVYSENQIEARKVITVQFMEKLLETRKKLGGDLAVIYKNKKIYFFINNATVVKDKKLVFKGISEEEIKQNVDNVKLLQETMMLL